MSFTALILNPIHEGAAAAERELAAFGPIRTYRTTPDSPGPAQVAQALSDGAESLVVAGGDGTQRLVAGALAGSGVPLGILATGTACVYARNLGIPLGMYGKKVATQGVPRAVDLGWASLDGSAGSPFLVAAGMGRDAETISEVRTESKRRLGWLAYAVAGLKTAGRPRIPLKINGQPVEAWTVLAGNIGKIPTASMFPSARPDDDRLHVLHLGVRSWADWIPVAYTGIARSRRDAGKLHRWGTGHVLIESEAPVMAQIDGDLFPGISSLEAWIDPGALLIRC